MEESFLGFQEVLEESAQLFYNSPLNPSMAIHSGTPKPQQLGLEALSPTLDTALQMKIEKSLGTQIQLQRDFSNFYFRSIQ